MKKYCMLFLKETWLLIHITITVVFITMSEGHFLYRIVKDNEKNKEQKKEYWNNSILQGYYNKFAPVPENTVLTLFCFYH